MPAQGAASAMRALIQPRSLGRRGAECARDGRPAGARRARLGQGAGAPAVEQRLEPRGQAAEAGVEQVPGFGGQPGRLVGRHNGHESPAAEPGDRLDAVLLHRKGRNGPAKLGQDGDEADGDD